MKHLIEFPLEAGGSILVEVDEPEPEGGIVRAARPGEVAEKARQTFEEALSKIRPVSQNIITKLSNLIDPPDEVGVEFGLKLSAEAGIVIAAGSVEANYKVTLKWEREKNRDGGAS